MKAASVKLIALAVLSSGPLFLLQWRRPLLDRQWKFWHGARESLQCASEEG